MLVLYENTKNFDLENFFLGSEVIEKVKCWQSNQLDVFLSVLHFSTEADY